MSTIDELKNEISELSRLERRTCDEATKDIKAALADKRAMLLDLESKKRIAKAKQYHELAELIGEMSKWSFLIFQFSGYNNNFKITNHVRWIECRNPDENSDEYDSHHYRYEKYDDDESLDLTYVRALHRQIKEHYERVVESHDQ